MNIYRTLAKIVGKIHRSKAAGYAVVSTSCYSDNEGVRDTLMVGYVFETKADASRYAKHMRQYNKSYTPVDIVKIKTSAGITYTRIKYVDVARKEEINGEMRAVSYEQIELSYYRPKNNC